MASMSEKEFADLQATMASQKARKNPDKVETLGELQEFIDDANETLRLAELQVRRARLQLERCQWAIGGLSILAVIDILTRIF